MNKPFRALLCQNSPDGAAVLFQDGDPLPGDLPVHVIPQDGRVLLTLTMEGYRQLLHGGRALPDGVEVLHVPADRGKED